MAEVIPKKSLGQHWLRDELSLETMCDMVDVGPTDTVLEIGPGLGTLTKYLLDRANQVVAVEFDDTLAVNLRQNLKLEGGPLDSKLTVVNEDILSFDLTKLPRDYKVVANIPYYLTSNLVRVLSESNNPAVAVALLVQKEVAVRAAARPGSMSLLSVSAQFYWEVSLGPIVPAELFTPPPKVDSQILVLKRRETPLFPGVDTKFFFRLVKAGFSQKRKTLVNALSAGLHLTKDEAKELLDESQIAHHTRAQALDLNQWYALYTAAGR